MHSQNPRNPSIFSVSSTLCLLAALLVTAGCSSDRDRNGELSKTLEMVDKDGTHYGTVALTPVGGGEVRDTDGKLIGRVVPPRD